HRSLQERPKRARYFRNLSASFALARSFSETSNSFRPASERLRDSRQTEIVAFSCIRSNKSIFSIALTGKRLASIDWPSVSPPHCLHKRSISASTIDSDILPP